MKITLTPAIESALCEEANRQKTTPEMLALDCLQNRFVTKKGDDPSETEQKTLADFLVGHIGVLSSGNHIHGGARLSENCGQKFTAALVQKRRQG
ncbi:MAG: hypothetical protein C4527_15050 [Candidatus Omnitrophota bacterium]|jgi:hypothetical protein|nr:MAG: hypothetical protein C4527_15050 [Candidatus Omnitrophota bacterium]